MKLDDIYDCMKKHLNDKVFLISDASMGSQNESIRSFLMENFKKQELLVAPAALSYEKGEIVLEGFTELAEGEAAITLTLKERRNGRSGSSLINVSFQLGLKSLDITVYDSKAMKADNVIRQYEFYLESAEKVDRTVSGDLISPVSFPDFMSILLGDKMDLGFLPPIPISGINLTYGMRNRLKIEDSYVAVTSLAVLSITDKLAVGRLGIEVQKCREFYGFALKGELTINHKVFPLIMRYTGYDFFFGLDIKEGGVEMLTLNDIAALAGIEDLSNMLPESFTNIGKPKLLKLIAGVPLNLSKVNTFEFEVKTTEDWDLLGIKGLSLRDIYIGFQFDFSGGDKAHITGSIEGVVSIASFSVGLFAKKTGPDKAYILGGRLPDKEGINFKQVISGFAEMLGFTGFKLPDEVPDILLRNAEVSFDTADSSFGAKAAVQITKAKDESMLEKLFNIEAAISVQSEVIGGKRTYSGNFAGFLEICEQKFSVSYAIDNKGSNLLEAKWEYEKEDESPLSLSNMLHAFGLEQIPDEIDSLKISITAVKLACAISKEEFVFRVECRKYGTLEFMVYKDKAHTRQYLFDVKCVKEISLSALPVVGKLGVLNDVSLKNLELIAASCDVEDKKISAGVSLKGAVHILKEDNEFLLESKKKNDMLPLFADENPLQAGGQSAMTKWFKLNKTLGVFELHRLGVTYRNGHAGFVMDASLLVNPLKIDLLELGLGLALSDPSDIDFYLSGLGLGFHSDALEISGSFMKEKGEVESYNGTLLIKAKDISIYAIGSYSQGSLFAFAVLDLPIGGPPAFYVTGLAAGFGYNRELKIPGIKEINKFPLVKGAFGKSGREDMAAEMMKDFIQISKGHHFVAAGIKFTSFRMVESFALVTVAFGGDLEINLLGLSEINVPANLAKGVTPIAHAQLALKVMFSPSKGVFAIMAELTDESYILSKNCRLMGGFAFYLWFGGEHKGDFVITLGGYHRLFKKPEHYPDVPRLGFIWNITDKLVFKGELYFALTPSCIMAGAGISAVYKSGELKAWFEARADLIISWKPFFYDIDIYIGLGASYRMFLLFGYVTFKLELSAALHIWGPNFAGTARITWFIISFTISFGDTSQKKQYLEWEEFKDSFLPHETNKKADANGDMQLIASTIAIADGVSSAHHGDGGLDYSVVNADKLKIVVKSAVPCTEIVANGAGVSFRKKSLGVLPMGENKSLNTVFAVTLNKMGGGSLPLNCTVLYDNVPNALWGLKENVPEDQSLIRDAVVGLVITIDKKDAFKTVPENYFLDLKMLSLYEKINKEFRWNTVSVLIDPEETEDNIAEFAKTIMKEDVATRRRNLIKELNGFGFHLSEDVGLNRMGSRAQDIFYEEMKLKTLAAGQ